MARLGWEPRLSNFPGSQSQEMRRPHLCLLVGSHHCPSLWAGTNGGTVYAFSLRVPPAERRMDETVWAEQGKCWTGWAEGA